MDNDQIQNVALRERVKELTCLYSLTQLVESSGIALNEILQGAVELLPPAWQYPERTAGRIVFDGQAYVTARFREGCRVQSAPIWINGQPRGRIEVAFIEDIPSGQEDPFLQEERNLLEAVARQLALIIERRQAEEDRFRLQDQLRHADRLATLGQLAAGIAHELNEPLGNILGFAQLAQKHRGLPSAIGQDLSKIVATCLHARQIINNLLLYSRQMPARKDGLSLNVVVEEALGLLEQRCTENDITIVRHLSADLPQIPADASQLCQVVVDLAVNAIQAMPKGGVLEITTRPYGDHVMLAVQDNGIGMSGAVLKEIFVPFFTTKDVDKGTGLGLPVVHGIVTAHGGTIRVQSAPGRGARFEIELPTDLGEQSNGDRMNDRAE